MKVDYSACLSRVQTLIEHTCLKVSWVSWKQKSNLSPRFCNSFVLVVVLVFCKSPGIKGRLLSLLIQSLIAIKHTCWRVSWMSIVLACLLVHSPAENVQNLRLQFFKNNTHFMVHMFLLKEKDALYVNMKNTRMQHRMSASVAQCVVRWREPV